MPSLLDLPNERLIDGSIASRRLPDGRILALNPLSFNRVRLVVGHGTMFWEDGW